MSYKVLFRGPEGDRWMPANGRGFRLLPGERQVLDERGNAILAEDDCERQVLEELQSKGVQLGDLIASATKLFGIKPCSKCEQRRQVLNELKKRGVKNTLQRLKEIGL